MTHKDIGVFEPVFNSSHATIGQATRPPGRARNGRTLCDDRTMGQATAGRFVRLSSWLLHPLHRLALTPTTARMRHKVVGNFGSEADVRSPVLPTFQIQ